MEAQNPEAQGVCVPWQHRASLSLDAATNPGVKNNQRATKIHRPAQALQRVSRTTRNSADTAIGMLNVQGVSGPFLPFSPDPPNDDPMPDQDHGDATDKEGWASIGAALRGSLTTAGAPGQPLFGPRK